MCDNHHNHLFSNFSSNNAEIQFQIAQMYYYGVKCNRNCTIKKDLNKSVEFSQKAANQGHIEANYMLGVIYSFNKKNYEKAIEYFEKSSLSKFQFKLGDIYFQKKDFKKAFYYFQLAAEKGSRVALYNLADCYRCGKGVEKNEKKAIKLYKMINTPNSLFYIGFIYEFRWTPEDDKKAFVYYLKAAKLGHIRAQYKIAKNYMKVKNNVYRNRNFYHQYASICYIDDEIKKKKYYDELVSSDKYKHKYDEFKCAQQKIIYSKNNVKNLQKAIKYFTMAAEKGDIYSQLELVTIYRLYERNDDLALKYLGMAAEKVHNLSKDFIKRINEYQNKYISKIISKDHRLYKDLNHFINLYI